MSNDSEKRFWHPRYWPAHLGFGLLRALSLLPYRWQWHLGRAVGRLAMRLSSKRRRIASRNLRLCFPDWGEDEVRRVLRQHFESLGISLFEMGMAYYRPQRFNGLLHWQGPGPEVALGDGHCIILTAHFGALEVGGIALHSRGIEFDAVFREDSDPLQNRRIRRGRERSARRTIEKSNIKEMVKSLRAGVPVWYAPDQSYRRKQSELLPFFGEPAMTNTATTALARLGRARVVCFFPYRRQDGRGYDLIMSEPLEDFPSDDAIADTRRITALFEQAIQRAPAEYFWVHRKFKGRPPSLPDAYANLAEEDRHTAS